MHRIKASQRAVLRAMLIQWEGQRKHFSLSGKTAGLSNFLCRDVVEGAELILSTPFAPVAILLCGRNDDRFCLCHRFLLFLFMSGGTQMPLPGRLLAPVPSYSHA